MKDYLYKYVEETDKKIEDKNTDLNELKKEHLIKISFFQHERLIHLLVTLFYALFMIMFFGFGFLFIGYQIAGLMILIFVLFYVIHYFRLEWKVQYLYKQYDKINEKLKNINTKDKAK